MDIDIIPWRVVVGDGIHLEVENLCTLEVVHLGNSIEEVVLESIDVGMVVALYVVHMAHMGMTHRHMVVVLESHKGVHHSHLIDMHHRMALVHSVLVEVVANRIDHMHMAPPIFDCPILDAHPHCSPHFLQYS
ncbi:hypothetical protein AHAS_Ahas15G0234300 [Arachis hypogaea]